MKQKPLFPSVLLIIVSVLLFCGMFLHFVQVLRDNLRYDTGITLRETARQGVNTLRAVTEGHLRTLRFIAARLTDMALNDPEATIKQLQAILKLREDKRLGFVLADGRVFSYIITADQDYAAYVLAIAAKKPIEFFKQMPARDYARLTMLVTAFLTN